MTLWDAPFGRELDTTPLPDAGRPKRIVACLNVWNDLRALQSTVASWLPYVSRVIAVDGAYAHTGKRLSTDGTREYLESLQNVTLVSADNMSQCQKRSAYFGLASEGEYLFIVDADETVHADTAAALLAIPDCDVGWIRVRNTSYTREYGQPRIIRWQPNLEYRGRHHWIYAGDRLLCTHQYGGHGFAHRVVNLRIENRGRRGRSAEHVTVRNAHRSHQSTVEHSLSAMPSSVMSDSAIGAREALNILTYAYRDDGIAPSRLHTAINRTSPHSSVFVKVRPGPFGVPDGYLIGKHQMQLSQALASADIIHYHTQVSASRGARASAKIVFHHHGSMLRANVKEYAAYARQKNALVLLSNLELFSHTDGVEAHWLPNTVPVERYLSLRRARGLDFSTPIKIAHSPSKPERKGTVQLERVVAHLRSRGYPLDLVMIHDKTHRASLTLKAECQLCFDSFWLGIQCSGIECAAMNMPVIAGDATVRNRYVQHLGACPYTFAEDEGELESQLTRLLDDRQYYAQEQERVHRYVVDWHDESAVVLRYLDLLDQKFQWRSVPLTAPVHRHAIASTMKRRIVR